MAMKIFLTLFRRPSQGANLSESIEMITSKERHAHGTVQQKSLIVEIFSRELTYPTMGIGISSSKVPLGGDMLVPRRV